VPAALAFGSGIHGAVAFLLRGVQEGKAPRLDEVQGYFESYWAYVGRCQEPYGVAGREHLGTPGGATMSPPAEGGRLHATVSTMRR
jgi:hypothetical protein